jgi:outer membrane protein assembly factor BamB
MLSTRTSLRLCDAFVVVLVLAGSCFGQSGQGSATSEPDTPATRTNWSQFGFTPDNVRFNPYETVLSTSNVGDLTLKWSHTLTGNGSYSVPVVVDGVVYVGGGERLYAFKAGTGADLWNVKFGAGASSAPPAVANGIVYVVVQKNSVWALKASTGAKLWKYSSKDPVEGLTLADGVVYAGAGDSAVFALDGKTGKALWTYATESGIYLHAPAVVNGTALCLGHSLRRCRWLDRAERQYRRPALDL